MEAGKRNISEVFNRARSLEIPFFQRSYVWSEANWSRFLDDMIDVGINQRDYFLGSVILKQRPTGTGAKIGDIRTVVDGQQRLTTLVLLFKVLYDAIGAPQEFPGIFFNLANELTLRHNHNDQEVFEAITAGRVTEDLRTRYSESRVLGAFTFFEKHKAQIAAIDPLVLHQKVYFVGIDLGAEEDEQQIFDTINSLGVALSTAELLKNELFDRGDLALYERTWKSAFEADEDCKQYWGALVTAGRAYRENIDLFLQSFLLIQPGVSDDLRVEGLCESFKTHLKTVPGRETFIEELTRCAELYRDFLNPLSLDQEVVKQASAERLNVVLLGLSTTTVVPYILYILRHVESKGERGRMFGLLESYLLRRVICRETTKNYNKLFTSFIRAELDTYEALALRLTSSEEVTSRFPTDAMVAAGFMDSNLTNQQARVALYLIERSVRHDAKHSTALSGFSHYSLEHLMPKNWPNKWGQLGPEASRERDQALRKLGNLSLLSSSLNKSIRDGDWATKKAGAGKRHGLDQYAGGLETLAEDLANETWTEAHIVARGHRLAGQALQTWPWPVLPAAAPGHGSQ